MHRIARWITVCSFAPIVFSAWALAAEDSPAVLVVPAVGSPIDVAIDLPDNVKVDVSQPWRLVEAARPAVSVGVQLTASIAADGAAAGESRVLARIPAAEADGGTRKFRLIKAEPESSPDAASFQIKDVGDASLGVWEGEKPVMVYNHGTITCEKVPESDARRSRACYVHPVWGLDGEVLTDDFPKDHYHHHGIFWAWPHVGIDGKEYDLWMYNNIQQRFVGWLQRQAGPVAAVLAVENGWFVDDKKVMIERVWMRSQRADDGSRSLDFEFTWIPVDKPITLWGAGGKSYGGLNLRFAPRQDTRITVPAGVSKEDLPDTPLEWADLTAKFAGAPTSSGAAIFIDPGHPDYPPTWLTRHYGVLCVGWPGVKPQTFEPGKPIKLNYRVWIHKDAPEVAAIQQAYDAYKAAMAVKWE